MDEFEKALVKCLRELLTKKEKVVIDGLGSFKPAHAKQHQQQVDGKTVLVPPRDYLVFSGEKN